MSTTSLLLNASYEPHAVIADRRAVVLLLAGLADIVEVGGASFRSPSLTVQVPSVLRLRRYVDVPAAHRSAALTNGNVLARDNYVCAYCHGRADTIDHVVPRSRGGEHRWENVTAACRRCNHKKGASTLAELGWTLDRTPYRPRGVSVHLLRSRLDPAWAPYLEAARRPS